MFHAFEDQHLIRFVRAVHRRLVVMRAVEFAGVGVALGSACALVLAGALWWIGRNALPMCAAAMAIGAACGFACGLLRRPSVMRAAEEADRQLGLADLLASALASRTRADDPWHGAVVAMAEARAAGLSPSMVVLHRLGARAWGGIGLAAALVLTVGGLSALPRESAAEDEAITRTDAVQSNDVRQTTLADRDAQRPARSPDSAGEKRDATVEGNDDHAQAVSPDSGERQGDAAGAGAVAGGTQRPPEASKSQGTGDGRLDTAGTEAAAGGQSRQRPDVHPGEAGEGFAAGSAEKTPSRSPPSPSGMPAPSGDAAARVQGVPDQYRDVARTYFSGD